MTTRTPEKFWVFRGLKASDTTIVKAPVRFYDDAELRRRFSERYDNAWGPFDSYAKALPRFRGVWDKDRYVRNPSRRKQKRGLVHISKILPDVVKHAIAKSEKRIKKEIAKLKYAPRKIKRRK